MDNAQLSSIDQGGSGQTVLLFKCMAVIPAHVALFTFWINNKKEKKNITTIFISQVVGRSIQNDNGWNEVGVQAQFVSKAKKIWVNTTVT